MVQKNLIRLFMVSIIVLAACGSSEEEMEREATAVAAAISSTQTAEAPTATFTPEPTNTLAPTATPTKTPTPTPAPLSPSNIFDLISPSVAFIETPTRFGSGALIDGGYVVTNAHVVWPFDKVRVVFPDGTEQEEVPVVGLDLMADLAVIGPLESSAKSLALADGENLDVGSDVFLIGYPGEVESLPQPNIVRGLISRTRQWEPLDITYLQTDASVAGGQSGGVLVSDLGKVIGISGLSFSEVQFGLVASAVDLLPRIEALIDGEDVDGLGDRGLPDQDGSDMQNSTLQNLWDTSVYVLDEVAGANVNISVTGSGDLAVGVVDAGGGEIAYVDDGFTGKETASIEVSPYGPHYVVIEQFAESPLNFTIDSDSDLIPYMDSDDANTINVGQPEPAALDYPGDVDYFTLALKENQVVNLRVESVSIDPFLLVTFPNADEDAIVGDDDSGNGALGLDAVLTYRALHDGDYLIIVFDATRFNTGGYLLTVDEPQSGAPTPMAPMPTATPIDTDQGPMSTYTSADGLFSIQYPAGWRSQPTSPLIAMACELSECHVDEHDNGLSIIEEDLAEYGLAPMSLEEYVEFNISFIQSMGMGTLTDITQLQTTTSQGLPAVRLEYALEFGGLSMRAIRLIYVHEGERAFNASFFFSTELDELLDAQANFSFDSFEVAGAELEGT